MKILVLNCGSSSVKYKLFDMNERKVVGSGGVEKIGMKGSFLKHTREDGEKVILEGEVLEHQVAIEYILGVLTSVVPEKIRSPDTPSVPLLLAVPPSSTPLARVKLPPSK